MHIHGVQTMEAVEKRGNVLQPSHAKRPILPVVTNILVPVVTSIHPSFPTFASQKIDPSVVEPSCHGVCAFLFVCGV